MCSVFSRIPKEQYAFETRSLRLGGHVTSVRLEHSYWGVLDEISQFQNVSVPKLLTKLYDEVLFRDGDVENFASLLRCACLVFLKDVRGNPVKEHLLLTEAQVDLLAA